MLPRRWIALCVFLALVISGCQQVDHPLNKQTVQLESRARNHTRSAVFADIIAPGQEAGSNVKSERSVVPTGTQLSPADTDGCFVGLAISGGGSRSANFAAACMFQLQRTGLLQKVDYISTVSGGSLAGAYYCVSDDSQWNPQNVQQKLTQKFATDLIKQTLLPWNDLAFAFTDWNRSDLLAGIFTERLFSRNGRTLTFGDLRADRPRLLINSTDVASARRFVFCNESFDELNSDLSRYPLSYAVTASSAVPVLLHPVAVQDFSTDFPQYHQLVDGGVTDNLGVQTLVETYASQVRQAADQGRPPPYPRGAVFILIDAHTRVNNALAEKRDIGLIASLKAAAALTSTALLNRASSATLAEIIVNGARDDETAAEMRHDIAQLNEQGFLHFTDKRNHPVRVLYLSLSQVSTLHSIPYGSFSENVNTMGTYFNIKPGEAFSLYEAAELLMKERFEGRVREILQEIGASEVRS